jgi:heat shock protein HslJ
MNLSSRRAIASVALAALLAGCATVSRVADTPSLDGTAWVLSSLPGRELLEGATATLSFDEGRASGTDGCNRYALSYSTSGSSLTIDPRGISTQMACPPEVMEQAGAFMAGLTSARGYRVEAGQLELLGGDGTLLATFAPQRQSVAGTSWRVVGYNNGRQAVVSVLGGSTLTMSFSADGRVSGSAGCNNYVATYTASGKSLTIGPAAATRKMCVNPEGVMEQEQQFLKALETVATARQEGDRLELRTATGAMAVNLAAEVAQ